MDQAPNPIAAVAEAMPVAASGNSKTPAARFGRLLDWFVPDAWRGAATMRQRFHVFVVAHLTGVILSSAVFVAVYAVMPGSGGLQWLPPLLVLFLLLPFGLRWTGRLDAMGAISGQLFALVVLLSASEFGQLLSPILPWLVLAFSTTLYYLAPWPRWRDANVALQIGQVGIFVIAQIYFVHPANEVPPKTLLVVALISAAAVVTMISIISFQVWSMHVDQRRQLEREIAERRAIEAERIRTEGELRRSRDHLAQSQTVGKIGSSEIVYHPEHLATWSDTLYTLLDRDPALGPIQPEEFIDFVHPDDRAFLRMRREREARGDYPRASEFRVVLRNGDVRWIRRQAEPIEWRDGKPLRAIATYLDVTEQKDAQQAVVELEEQLSQAHKMEAIGQLTGGVAHDFNNLLAVLLGRLQMIDEALVDPRPGDTASLRNWVGSCIRAVNRGATLTKSMMAFSRQQALAPVTLNVNDVVADMEEMLRRALGENYAMQALKSTGLWKTEADAGQLQNALLNLVLNARDAMPAGGVLIIETRNTRLDADYVARHLDVTVGDYVELSVTDEGTGMTSDVVKKAFEPFFTTKEVGKGSGLGLSMVYGFVTQSGGHVAIDSQVGQGTSVRIYLPRKEGDKAAAGIAPPRAAPATPERTTILLVEDNDDLRDVTRRQIERMGYTVFAAAHAHDGLALLGEHPEIRVLVSDVVLPQGMNGIELAETATDRHPLLKVVLISGYNDEHEAFKRAQGRLPLRFLQKPFQPDELAGQIRAALDSA